MIGNNLLILNEATVKQALNEYLNKRFMNVDLTVLNVSVQKEEGHMTLFKVEFQGDGSEPKSKETKVVHKID